MFKSPLVVGVRQYRDWSEENSIEGTLYGLGLNTGNMMFTHSLLTVLEGARRGSFTIAPQELEGCDVIVVACANWINDYDDFGWFADRLEKTSLPVVLVGVGAQSTLDMKIPQVKPGTLRLLNLVKDRSKSISARGVFTCEVLEHLGIKNAEPTGCPSLLLAGPDGPSIRAPENISFEATCVHATRHGVQPASALDKELYRLAFREGMDIVLQSETPDIYCALGREAPDDKKEKFTAVLKDVYGSQDLGTIADYLREHGRVFTNVESWLAYMRTKQFCFGTRIHGTVASLVANTAATLIAHDSRTLEMAKAMPIPHMRASEDLTESVSSALTNAPHPFSMSEYEKYECAFCDFFEANDIRCIEDVR